MTWCIFCCFLLGLRIFGGVFLLVHKQLSRDVLKKSCSENIQQSYRRPAMLKGDLFSYKFAGCFETPFLKNTSERLHLMLLLPSTCFRETVFKRVFLSVSLKVLMMFSVSAIDSVYRQKLCVTEKKIMAAGADLENFKSNVLSKLSTLYNSARRLKIIIQEA